MLLAFAFILTRAQAASFAGRAGKERMEFFVKLADIIVLLVLAALVGCAIWYLRKRKKSGGCAGCSGCCNDCSYCAQKDECTQKPEDKKEDQ